MTTPADNNGGRRSKRGHGEGSIVRLPDGRWQGRIMLGRKPNGRPDRPKVIGATRGEVQRRLAELKRKAEQGERTDSSKQRQSVAQYVETWLATARENTRDRSHARYSEVLHKHLIPALSRHKLRALRPDAIATLYASKRVEGLPRNRPEDPHLFCTALSRWR